MGKITHNTYTPCMPLSMQHNSSEGNEQKTKRAELMGMLRPLSTILLAPVFRVSMKAHTQVQQGITTETMTIKVWIISENPNPFSSLNLV